MSLDDDIAHVFRQESARVIAGLVRRFGDIDVAEEAVQDAFAIAAERWHSEGLPPNPGGWITTTAQRRALDRVRRESSRHRRSVAATELHTPSDEPRPAGPGGDDRLRLIFTCCHPALDSSAQIALTLRLIAGLETNEIARAFLVSDATMAQRLVRVKRKIAAAKIPYRIPADHELTDRLGPVLAVVYLIFNEGYIAATSDTLVRRDLCDEAIRLARLLVQLMPDEPEAIGLLALMLLSHARTPARTDRHGEFVRLADQDRTLWDFAMIGEGHELVRQCLRRNRPGPYQYQAAINAVHTDARRADATDWAQIVVLYNQYFEADPSPIVALNRAIAIGELEGPEAGLDALDKIQRTDYAYFHAARAEFLKRANRPTDALDAITQALNRTSNATERRHLERERRTLRAEATIQKRGANARSSQ